MRSSKSRSRNKSNRQRTLGNIVNRVFDSSGPEGKVRGTPQQIIEKYLTLARDAQLSNDRVAEQSFLQHAEHYTRLLSEAQREQAERQQQFTNQRDENMRDDQPEHGDHRSDQRNGQMNGNGGQNGHGQFREQPREREQARYVGASDTEGAADSPAEGESGPQPDPRESRSRTAPRSRAKPTAEAVERPESAGQTGDAADGGLPPVISTDDERGLVETPETANPAQSEALPEVSTGAASATSPDFATEVTPEAQSDAPKAEARPATATRRRTTRASTAAPRTRRKAEPKLDGGASKEPVSES